MPLLTKKRLLAAKTETTVGTAIGLSATDATVNCFDIQAQADISMSERMRQGGFGQLENIPEGYGGTVTFRTDCPGDGAAGVPTWASLFLPACGFVNSMGTFSATAEAPGSNVKTLTIGVYEDGLLKQLRGAVGNAVITAESGKLISIEWTFTGIWDTPSDVSILSPTYDTNIGLRAGSADLSVGGWAPCVQSMTIDLGNNVILRECQSDTSGYLSGLITDRLTTVSINPEATLVATNSHYTDWTSVVEKSFSYSADDGTDDVTFQAGGTTFQITNVQEGDRNGNQIDQIDAQINSDDFQIVFGAP